MGGKYFFVALICVSCLIQGVYAQDCNCAHTIDINTDDVDANNLDIAPGDTVCIAPGNRTHLQLQHFEGAPGKPLVLINCGGLVEIENNFLGYGFSIQNSRYFKLTGTGDPGQEYGIKINGTQSGASGLTIGNLSSDFEVEHLEITNAGFAGIMAKTDPSCDESASRGNFYMNNVLIHDNYVHDVGGEGLYIGNSFYSGWNTTCDGAEVTLYPHDIIGLRVYDNIVENIGWDGIQISCASQDTEIYGNSVLGYGLTGADAHTNGIQIGGGTTGKVYNNVIKDGNGNGIIALGLGDNLIFNNLIVRPGGYGVFCDSRVTIEGSEIAFINNTIIDPVEGGILNYSEITDNLYFNNIISGANGNIVSSGEIIANILSISLLDSLLGISTYFADPASDNFHLKLLSPAINSGTDVSDFGIQFDQDRLERPVSSEYDAGAFEYNSTDTVSDLDIQVFSKYVNCSGSNDGTIYVEGTGGSPPYSYSWSSGASDQTLNSLPPGTYTVTVTDIENTSRTRAIDIYEPEPLAMDYFNEDVSCHGRGNGFIGLTVRGGSPPYDFNWSTGGSDSGLDNLDGGTYAVMVTDRNNCSASRNFTIAEPEALEVSYEVVPETCPEKGDGAITLEMRGGARPYHFNWSTGDTTQNLENVTPGRYTVDIVDQNGCSHDLEVLVTSKSSRCEVIAYPNPFENQITIEFPESPAGPVSVYVTDVFGKVIFHDQQSLGQETSMLSIDVSGLALRNGVYILTLEAKSIGVKTFKLIKV